MAASTYILPPTLVNGFVDGERVVGFLLGFFVGFFDGFFVGFTLVVSGDNVGVRVGERVGIIRVGASVGGEGVG